MTDLSMRLPRMKEWSRHGCLYPTRSNNGRSLKIYDNKADDRYNDICVLEYIGQGSDNNPLLWFAQSKCEITLAVNQFEVEVIVYRLVSALLIKIGILTDRIVTYIEYDESY